MPMMMVPRAARDVEGGQGVSMCIGDRECNCERLLEPLGDADTLPSVVHLDVLRGTVGAWVAQERAQTLTMGVDTLTVPAPELTMREIGVTIPIPQDTPPPVLDSEKALTDAGGYPVLYTGRPLWCVVRQWAEGPPDVGVANKLLAHPGWTKEVNTLVAVLLEEQPAPINLYVRRREAPEMRRFRLNDHLDDAAIMARLRVRGLPASPSIVAHLRATAQEAARAVASTGRRTHVLRDVAPLSALGALITTLVYENAQNDRPWSAGVWLDEGSYEQRRAWEGGIIATMPRSSIAKLRRRADAIENAHVRWCKRLFGAHVFEDSLDLSPRTPARRPLPRTTTALLDWERVALEPDRLSPLFKTLRHHQHQQSRAAQLKEISDYLDRTYHLVTTARRRRNAQALKEGQADPPWDIKPPKTWRQTVTREVLRRLSG